MLWVQLPLRFLFLEFVVNLAIRWSSFSSKIDENPSSCETSRFEALCRETLEIDCPGGQSLISRTLFSSGKNAQKVSKVLRKAPENLQKWIPKVIKNGIENATRILYKI